MLTRLTLKPPQFPAHVDDVKEAFEAFLKNDYDFKRSIVDYLESLNKKGVLNITQAKIQDSTLDNTPIGATTPAAGTFTSLTSTGNNVLGDAQADTLNVGAGDIQKDAAGNTGFGGAAVANNKVHVFADNSINNQLTISDTRGYNAPPSGQVVWRHQYSSSNAYDYLVYITGAKENATDGNKKSYLLFATHDGTTLAERARIGSDGNFKLASGRLLALDSSGSDAVCGNATLVAGTVTVSTTAVTANSLILLTRKTSGGTIGTAITYTISAGTSFTINSDNILDTSTFSWVIIEKY